MKGKLTAGRTCRRVETWQFFCGLNLIKTFPTSTSGDDGGTILCLVTDHRLLTRKKSLQVLTLIPYRPKRLEYKVIQKDGLNFVRLYFLNYTWYVNDLHNI